MKKFILKTTYLSIPVIVITIIIELLLRNIPNNYSLKREYMDMHSSQIETLVLGNSHSFFGLNPSYFSSNTFNSANVSQSLNLDLEILNKYESRLESLETIILPVSYFTFFTNLVTGAESWRIKNYNIYYNINISNSIKDNSEFFGNGVITNLRRLASYYISGNSSITCSPYGWDTTYKSENSQDLNETGITAAKRHSKDDIDSIKNQNTLNENKIILSTINSLSKKKNIKLILFTPPAYKTYRENLNEEQLNTSIKMAEEIAAYNDNCIYLNLLNDTNFVAKDFYDADHLSEIGAKKLSMMISEVINKSK